MSSTIKYADSMQLLRSIRRELGRSIGSSGRSEKRVKDDASIQYMVNVMRENQVTERRFCRPQDHYKYFAQTYLTYLQSSRRQVELTNKYFNKGDRSIEESARLVGLELPKLNTKSP